jgi:hypothetical protein
MEIGSEWSRLSDGLKQWMQCLLAAMDLCILVSAIFSHMDGGGKESYIKSCLLWPLVMRTI